jgi:ketosteroid isomerase-like protein
MRSSLAAIVALCMFAIPAIGAGAPSPGPQPPAQILDLAQAVVDAANANHPSKLAGLFTGDAIVIDELPPYAWTGASAGVAWWTDIAKFLRAHAITSLRATALAVSEYSEQGDAAYMVQPLRITTTASGKTRTEEGTQTYTFRKVDGAWRISSAVWTTKP